jgi:hypothetical protein
MLHTNIFLVVQSVPFFQHSIGLNFNSKFNVLGSWTKLSNIPTTDIHKHKDSDDARLILKPCLSLSSLTCTSYFEFIIE